MYVCIYPVRSPETVPKHTDTGILCFNRPSGIVFGTKFKTLIISLDKE